MMNAQDKLINVNIKKGRSVRTVMMISRDHTESEKKQKLITLKQWQWQQQKKDAASGQHKDFKTVLRKR
jgi:adenylyl- and sulfurtransferase ThiI